MAIGDITYDKQGRAFYDDGGLQYRVPADWGVPELDGHIRDESDGDHPPDFSPMPASADEILANYRSGRYGRVGTASVKLEAIGFLARLFPHPNGNLASFLRGIQEFNKAVPIDAITVIYES